MQGKNIQTVEYGREKEMLHALVEGIWGSVKQFAYGRKYAGLILGLAAVGFASAGFAAPSPAAAERAFLGDNPGIPLAASAKPDTAQTISALRQQATMNGAARVIVGVRAAFAPEGLMVSSIAAQQRNEIARKQSEVLGKLALSKNKADKVKQFETIPFMALEVDAMELEALVNSGEITSIEEDRLAVATLAQSSPLIGATTAWNSGYTGAGQTVAILDTGVDKAHDFLEGKVVSEACYSTNDNVAPYYATSVCPGGVASSTSANSAMPYGGACPTGECDHGTHVAGIVAGEDGSFSGVAKGASLIAIQVFTRFAASYCGDAPCVMSYSSDQILGLERVYALRGTYNIAAVNMSLGGGQYSSQATCDSENLTIKTAIDNLRAAGIATVISSGNNGYTSSMGAPGCISSAVSVGSTWDAAGGGNNCDGNDLGTSSTDEIACYSNSASFLNLLAPGSSINSSIPGGGYASWQGTSMAAPQVAGAWAVLKQKNTTLTVNDALTALTSTGVSVTDSRNAIAKRRIQVDAALNAIGGGGGATPSAPTIGTATAGNGQISVVFTPGSIGTGTLVNHTASCSNGVASTATGTASPITVTGLTNGTTYTCYVRTTSTVGDSAWSAASNAVTPSSGITTTLIADSFEGGGWSAAQVTGSAGAWNIVAAGTYPVVNPHGGSNLAKFNSYTSASGNQTRWYRTSGFSLSGGYNSAVISYWIYRDTGYSYSNDRIQVQVSTDGSTWSNLGSEVSRYNGSTGWQQITVNLSAYLGQPNVRLGFLATSAYGNDIHLDDVLVVADGGTLPAAPTGVAAASGNTQISAAFTPGAIGSGTLVNYTVSCGGAGGSRTGTGTSSPIVVTGLTNGTAYTCWVKTTSTIGTGPWSAASNTAVPGIPPSAPTIGTATAGNAQISAAFTPGAIGTGTLVNYTVSCGGAGGSITGTGTSSPIVVTGLTNGTAYTCWVKTTSTIGTSAWSAGSNSATPIGGTPPAAPTIGTATPGNAQISVAFTPGAIGTGALVNHTVSCGGAGASRTGTGTSSPIVVTGLTNGTAYTCWVKTTSTVGTSAWSAASNSATPSCGGCTPPAAPTGMAATANQISVAFTPGAIGSGTLVNYTVSCSNGAASASATGTASPIVVTGLSHNTSYTCYVKTTSTAGDSPWSVISNTAIP